MLCLVTDRRRLCPGTSSFDVARKRVAAQVLWAVDARVELVLVRERDLEAADLAALVADLVRLSRSTDTRIVVNDRVDVALASGADGVHLRGDSMAAEAVRRITPTGFLVGRSVHGVAQAMEAGPVDYLLAGTVFSTASKPGTGHLLGLEGLAAIVQAVAVPVLAIGGVTPERLGDVAAAGAAGVAAIGMFLDRFDRSQMPS